jgi:hypothetical protein
VTAHPRTATDDLPGENGAVRWSANRKAELLRRLSRREITRGAALRRYGLTEEELGSWEVHAARFGRAGLYATKTQFFRGASS